SEAVRLGARGLVLKDSAPDTVIECVRRVHAGEELFDLPSITRALTATMQRESDARDALAVLTQREVEIVQMVAQGLRNRAIAARLSISEGTVKVHLHNVYEKLRVDGRLGLTLYAQQHGLVSGPCRFRSGIARGWSASSRVGAARWQRPHCSASGGIRASPPVRSPSLTC